MSDGHRTRPRARDRRGTVPRRPPTTRIRHWKPTPIGSDSWWHDLCRLGVDRSGVELAVEYCPTDPETKKPDPHRLDPPPGAAARAAAHLLLFSECPELHYSVLSGVTHAWFRANRSVKEWIVSQFVEILWGTGSRVEPLVYLLWVDFFEVPDRARFVFPRLLKLLPREHWKEVLQASGPVPWDVKIAAYREAASDPAMHGSLAVGLASSFHDVFGSVAPVEARALFHQIQVADPEIRGVLDRVMTEPIRCRVLAVITVDQTDARWTKWIPDAPESEPSFLLLLQLIDRPSIWMKGSELLLDNRVLARVVHYGFPFDTGIRHHVSGTWRAPDPVATSSYSGCWATWARPDVRSVGPWKPGPWGSRYGSTSSRRRCRSRATQSLFCHVNRACALPKPRIMVQAAAGKSSESPYRLPGSCSGVSMST